MPVTSEHPPVYADGRAPAPPPQPPRNVLTTAIQAVILVLLLSVLGAFVLVFVALASLLNVPNQVAGGIGERVGAAASSAARSAQVALQGVTDPNHPPSGLTYDTEFTSLQTWHVGDQLPAASQYVLTLREIRRREGADSPDTALYAVVHAELRQPHEIRLLGQLIHSDSDLHDHAVYKGESFRIGRALYRVNWVSQEESALAAATYRNPDAVSAPLKFAYE
jgi:hypothetical protein